MKLTEEIARRFAGIALGHVTREYPHKLDHVMAGDADVQPPRALHPVFFGSFDWHSCVHGWWTLLTLRRRFPGMPEAREIERLADRLFTRENISTELAYLNRAESRAFERPYGWAWLLYLHLEAERHGDKDWAAQLAPLAAAFGKRLGGYLEVLTYPITVGTHFNSAFALVLAREWAEGRDPALVAAIDGWASSAFAGRKDYAGWEPGGDEFLSPVLTAALLMSRVLPAPAFSAWFDTLVVANGWLERECRPVHVSDRSDGKIAHLDGLNLSRAWCLTGIDRALERSAGHALLGELATSHFGAGIDHVAGDYAGEHWLASFALLAFLANESDRDEPTG